MRSCEHSPAASRLALGALILQAQRIELRGITRFIAAFYDRRLRIEPGKVLSANLHDAIGESRALGLLAPWARLIVSLLFRHAWTIRDLLVANKWLQARSRCCRSTRHLDHTCVGRSMVTTCSQKRPL